MSPTEKQRLPNLRYISFFLSPCPPVQEEWQGASIDIKAAHKRMLIREDERGSLLFKFDNRIFAYRSAHFGAKTSTWHWGRVSGAVLRLLHVFLYFRHVAWVYVDDFLFPCPESISATQFALAIVLLRIIGAPLSWKKLEFDSVIDWNGWSIQPATMTAQLLDEGENGHPFFWCIYTARSMPAQLAKTPPSVGTRPGRALGTNWSHFPHGELSQ